jgi:hypothetical protein
MPQKGFDYLAGGGGVILNKNVVEKIVAIGHPAERFVNPNCNYLTTKKLVIHLP